MITYYTIVHADTKRRIDWQPGKPGYGWPNQPHQILGKIERLEADFEDDNKLVLRQVIGGARPQIAYLTLAQAKKDIPEKAQEYLKVHPELENDGLMQRTLKALTFFKARGQRAKAARAAEAKPELEDLF